MFYDLKVKRGPCQIQLGLRIRGLGVWGLRGLGFRGLGIYLGSSVNKLLAVSRGYVIIIPIMYIPLFPNNIG